jgi:S1-C subfamily serine protease
VLTIGYLTTEAESIWLVAHDGRAVPGHALAYDQATGFGLVLALGHLGVPTLEIGRSQAIGIGDSLIMAAGGGKARAMETKLVARQEFAGYWEYLLDEALFVGPAHPFWSGAALIDQNGKLIGIGSLILQQGGGGAKRADINMVVPIDLLTPILPALLTSGGSGKPPRPWLGMFVTENEGGLVVGGLAEDGPAEKAGVQVGDLIDAIEDEEVSEVAAFWRALWASGAPGVAVKLHLSRDNHDVVVRVITGDRNRMLRSPKLH